MPLCKVAQWNSYNSSQWACLLAWPFDSHFLLVFYWHRPAISNCFGDIKLQIYPKTTSCKWQSVNGRACAYTILPVELHASKIFYSAWHGEAMFQIWWRSVHNWRHSLVDSRRLSGWRTDTGRTPPDGHHWTCQNDFIFCPMLCMALDRQ